MLLETNRSRKFAREYKLRLNSAEFRWVRTMTSLDSGRTPQNTVGVEVSREYRDWEPSCEPIERLGKWEHLVGTTVHESVSSL